MQIIHFLFALSQPTKQPQRMCLCMRHHGRVRAIVRYVTTRFHVLPCTYTWSWSSTTLCVSFTIILFIIVIIVRMTTCMTWRGHCSSLVGVCVRVRVRGSVFNSQPAHTHVHRYSFLRIHFRRIAIQTTNKHTHTHSTHPYTHTHTLHWYVQS